jgi:Fe-S-cluster containining protein
VDDLRILHNEIGSRVHSISSAHPEWPCRKGCDLCCRHLAAIPQLTPAEIELLHAGLATLPDSVRAEVEARLADLEPTPPIVCPFLDRAEHSCLIYEYRPVACRTYGFYVERDKGLYCEEIRRRVDNGEFADVVWGNACSVDAKLKASENSSISYSTMDRA